MRGMVLAAGFGTRFRPVTWGLPKPMIPVCNRPLIGWPVRALVDSDIREIVVNLHHLPDPIRDYLTRNWNGEADFQFSLEHEILGTGGALREVSEFLAQGGKTFVLLNGDTIQRPPFHELVRTREKHDDLATLLLRTPPPGDSFTDVWMEEARINRFGEGGAGRSLMFGGAHAMSARVFELLPGRAFSSLTEDVYIPALERGTEQISAVVHDGIWFDVGKPTRYMEATTGLLRAFAEGNVDLPPGSTLRAGVLSDRTSEIEGKTEHTVIGERSRISESASVRDSVIWNDCSIESGSIITRSIIAHDVKLPRGALLENVTVCNLPDTEPDPEQLSADRIDGWLVRAVDENLPHRFEV